MTDLSVVKKVALIKGLLTFVVLIVVSACSQIERQTVTEPFPYAVGVSITTHDQPDSIAEQYDGEVVVWRPEAGLAILGVRESSRLQSLGSQSLLVNTDAFSVPEGFDAWSGGFDAWSGGFDAWSGGFDAWSGGTISSDSSLSDLNADEWQRIRLKAAQNLATSLGSGIKIAVLDTGIDLQHSAFSGKLAPQTEWFDFVDFDNIPEESVPTGHAYGHGTAVAGVILQIAPNATILPIRVLGPDGYGELIDVAQGIDWAITMGADLIHLSLGTDFDDGTLATMVDYAASRGVYVVSSSGNTGDEAVTYPAALSLDPTYYGAMSIGVGSAGLTDKLSTFSTYGPKLEMVALGEEIYTVMPDEQIGYAIGTSFAAPMVSGGLALALAEIPGSSAAPSDYSLLPPISGKNILSDGPITPGEDGLGRLNLEAYLLQILGTQP